MKKRKSYNNDSTRSSSSISSTNNGTKGKYVTVLLMVNTIYIYVYISYLCAQHTVAQCASETESWIIIQPKKERWCIRFVFRLRKTTFVKHSLIKKINLVDGVENTREFHRRAQKKPIPSRQTSDNERNLFWKQSKTAHRIICRCFTCLKFNSKRLSTCSIFQCVYSVFTRNCDGVRSYQIYYLRFWSAELSSEQFILGNNGWK